MKTAASICCVFCTAILFAISPLEALENEGDLQTEEQKDEPAEEVEPQTNDSSSTDVMPLANPVTEDQTQEYAPEIERDHSGQNNYAEIAHDSSRIADTWWAEFVVQILGLAILIVVIIQTKFALAKATKANEISSDTAKAQLRAYLHVISMNIDTSEIRYPKIDYKFKNFGQTPAKEISKFDVISIKPYPLTNEDHAKMLEDAEHHAVRFSVGPSEPKVVGDLGLTIPLTNNQVGVVLAGGVALYVVVELKYVDVFGDAHTTRVCAYSNGHSYKAGAIMNHTDIGNDID